MATSQEYHDSMERAYKECEAAFKLIPGFPEEGEGLSELRVIGMKVDALTLIHRDAPETIDDEMKEKFDSMVSKVVSAFYQTMSATAMVNDVSCERYVLSLTNAIERGDH